MEKKSERLEVRLGYREKQDFVEACDLQGDNPSGAIRRFINGYVKRSDGDVLASAWRGSARRKLLPKFIFGVTVLAAAGLLSWTAYNHLTRTSDSDVFAVRDRNNDGQLKGDELGYAELAEQFLRIMDVDNSGGIDLNEFQANGKMAYVLSGAKDGADRHKPRSNQSAYLIKFDIQPERTKSGTYSLGGFQKGLERVVFWHDGGGVTVMEGPVDIELDDVFISE